MVFGVWLNSDPGSQSLHQPVLYPHKLTCDASPKAISGRTSYHQVRLAFHPYPQVMEELFNVQPFGPPVGFTLPSPCPGIDHLDSGLLIPTNAQLGLAFATASLLTQVNLAGTSNSLDHSSTGTPSRIPKYYYSGIALRQLVDVWFQVLFHSPNRGSFRLSLTVLVHYRSPESI